MLRKPTKPNGRRGQGGGPPIGTGEELCGMAATLGRRHRTHDSATRGGGPPTAYVTEDPRHRGTIHSMGESVKGKPTVDP